MKIYRSAIYLRLSKEETGKQESSSIAGQRALLHAYAEDHPELNIIREYADDGFPGTTFDRPAFKQMIHDAAAGKIDCILVKDFSRLGRDYIGVGDHVEQVFPRLGIRFISVNNKFDSGTHTSMDLGLEISNLVNGFYSKDISKKRRSANRILWKQGHATSMRVPFGYYWDCSKKGKWQLDPTAAGYVRRIFGLAIEGLKPSKIAERLNSECVPVPSVYASRRMTGRSGDEMRLRWTTNRSKASEERQLWDSDKVTCILKRREYTGALIMNKRVRHKDGSTGRTTVQLLPESEQVVVESAHEAIVTAEEFEKAQHAIRSRSPRKCATPKVYPLRGLVLCPFCGRTMAHVLLKAGSYFQCNHCRPSLMQDDGKESKVNVPLRYPEPLVNEAVLQEIIKLGEVIGKELKEFDRSELPKAMSPQTAHRLEDCLKELKEQNLSLYETYADGKISREEYLSLKSSFSPEINAIEIRLNEIKTFLSHRQALLDRLRSIQDTLSRLLGSESTPSLTRDLALAFVQSVRIHDIGNIEVILKTHLDTTT